MAAEATDSPVIFGGELEIFLHVVSCPHIHQFHKVVLHKVGKELALELKLQFPSNFLIINPFDLL
jgi:hypothetical protein